MTSTRSAPVFRSIVVMSEQANPAAQPTCRLLAALGHHVSPVISPEQAMLELQTSGADLVVIDLPDVGAQRRLLERLAALPEHAQPRHVAVFIERAEEYALTMHAEHDSRRFHAFLKPLHVHGLLSVLRSIESEQLATA